MMKNLSEHIKFFSICLVITIALVQTVGAVPTENEYGNVKAWFNGEEATVKNVKLKIGEPAYIEVIVKSNISGHVIVGLANPLVTKPYKVLEGSDIEERIENLDVSSGWSKKFNWKIEPNGDWKNGNAPINVLVTFYNTKNKVSKKIEISIADPYILDEQYSGSTPARTTGASQPTPTSTSPETQQAPFLSALAALVVILGVWTIQKKTNSR
jgi:sarcinarray family protein